MMWRRDSLKHYTNAICILSYTWEKFLTTLFTLVKVLEWSLRRTFCSLSPVYFVLCAFNKRPTQVGHLCYESKCFCTEGKENNHYLPPCFLMGRTELQSCSVLQQVLQEYEALQYSNSNVLRPVQMIVQAKPKAKLSYFS